ncbi:SDR family oxidoreductase [Agreia sp. COWG]|uniref:SDR family NAD(P)-dependent oxidoreductase n=1 Tax=Agreia sp. COWG TaxID=2773266 RepID=UPI001926BB00|nr:SDR family oxidoreductase [Agreia sp. COWG]CAD6005028.1 putative 17-beta-estradiol 17-dehydrogenase [Agreia sp. COWG]
MAVALVTGGTSGIGAAFSRSLASQGYDLVLVARQADRLESMAAEIRALGRSVEILQADLADRADVTRVAERLEDPSRPIDMLVNNAGFGVHTSLIDTDISAHDHAFEVMCRAVLVLSGAAARGMLPRGRGKIVNVSSTAAHVTMGSYSAIKSWVLSFSEGLAVELRGTGIGVTALCPGWVRTEFHERAGITASSIPNFLWLDAEYLVAACIRDVERGKVISIPSVRYRTLIWLARHAPRSAIRSVSGSISSSRKKPVS